MTADEIRKEAHMAWQMCADIHHCYAKGKDPYYDIRQPIFQQRADEMRMAAVDETARAPSPCSGRGHQWVVYQQLAIDCRVANAT